MVSATIAATWRADDSKKSSKLRASTATGLESHRSGPTHLNTPRQPRLGYTSLGERADPRPSIRLLQGSESCIPLLRGAVGGTPADRSLWGSPPAVSRINPWPDPSPSPAQRGRWRSSPPPPASSSRRRHAAHWRCSRSAMGLAMLVATVLGWPATSQCAPSRRRRHGAVRARPARIPLVGDNPIGRIQWRGSQDRLSRRPPNARPAHSASLDLDGGAQPTESPAAATSASR